VIILDAEISTVGPDILEMVKEQALDDPKKRARVCVNHEGAAVQEMVIVMSRDSYVRPHRHPRIKSESYHLIDGELQVKVFQKDGTLYREFKLNKKTPFIRMKGGWFHQPVPLSEWVTYHEVYEGPFNKEKDVEYATWADAETV